MIYLCLKFGPVYIYKTNCIYMYIYLSHNYHRYIQLKNGYFFVHTVGMLISTSWIFCFYLQLFNYDHLLDILYNLCVYIIITCIQILRVLYKYIHKRRTLLTAYMYTCCDFSVCFFIYTKTAWLLSNQLVMVEQINFLNYFHFHW